MADSEKENARREIQRRLAEAERLIGECVRLADEHKIVFRQPDAGGYGTYTPEGRENDEMSDYDLVGPRDYWGWQSSDLCS